jgi:phosphoribosyl 1,2-cyclic phosphodiesterase
VGPLRLKFWGTRGLISSPRQETAIFGGNTTSIQVLYKDHLILVDSGFGCTNLGDALLDRILRDRERLTVHVLYTHFHWDHVQGLPFFKPIYFPTTTMNLYAPVPTATTLENLNILFDGSYSPFESLLTMQARVNLHQLTGALEVDGLKIEYHPLDHGHSDVDGDGDVYAYKFSCEDAGTTTSVCIATDHEARPSARNSSLIRFAKGVDLLVHDGQFTDAEYAKHVGWGHSAASMALDNALKMQPGLTLLTHHDPARNDKDLQTLHRTLMQNQKYRHVNFEFAREEVVYEVATLKPVRDAG